jgi:hypothetical protein
VRARCSFVVASADARGWSEFCVTGPLHLLDPMTKRVSSQRLCWKSESLARGAAAQSTAASSRLMKVAAQVHLLVLNAAPDVGQWAFLVACIADDKNASRMTRLRNRSTLICAPEHFCEFSPH